MASDRFVAWTKKFPSHDEVRDALKGYLGDMATIEEVKHVLFATFSGRSSSPFYAPFREDRWFEVHMTPHSIDVLTRQQDPLINAIAQGFAELCAHHWEGILKNP